MSNETTKIEDNKNIISATSTGEVKKLLEGRWLKTTTIINIDDEEFEGMWDGEPYYIKKGESETFPTPLAEHLAAAMATKILSKAGKIPNDNVSEYNDTLKIILGKKVIDFSALTYEEMQSMAKDKGIDTKKDNGKLRNKAELIELLSK